MSTTLFYFFEKLLGHIWIFYALIASMAMILTMNDILNSVIKKFFVMIQRLFSIDIKPIPANMLLQPLQIILRDGSEFNLTLL